MASCLRKALLIPCCYCTCVAGGSRLLRYACAGSQLVALDFGPCGAADITANLAEEVPAGPILQDHADAPASGPDKLPLLYMRTATLPLSHSLVQQVHNSQ